MTQIQWQDASGAFQVIDVDATLSERHSAEADVTEDPVEDGSALSDNVRAKARTLALEVFIADDHKASGNPQAEPAGLQPGRAERVLSQFEAFEREGTRLTIIVGGRFGFGRVYENMVVVSASTTRAGGTQASRDNLTINLVTKEIRSVSSAIVAVQSAREDKGKKKITGGDQNPKALSGDESAPYDSSIFQLFDLGAPKKVGP